MWFGRARSEARRAERSWPDPPHRSTANESRLICWSLRRQLAAKRAGAIMPSAEWGRAAFGGRGEAACRGDGWVRDRELEYARLLSDHAAEAPRTAAIPELARRL